jgi:hypothetical protein
MIKKVHLIVFLVSVFIYNQHVLGQSITLEIINDSIIQKSKLKQSEFNFVFNNLSDDTLIFKSKPSFGFEVDDFNDLYIDVFKYEQGKWIKLEDKIDVDYSSLIIPNLIKVIPFKGMSFNYNPFSLYSDFSEGKYKVRGNFRYKKENKLIVSQFSEFLIQEKNLSD